MPASIFNGTAIKLLKDILRFKGGVELITGDSDDPTSVAKNAPQGSIYIRSGTSEIYKKTDNGSSTNWTLLPNTDTTYTASGNGIELSGTEFQLEFNGSSITANSSGLFVPADGISNTELRLNNNGALRARNNAGSADIDILRIGSTDLLEILRDMYPAVDNSYDLGSSSLNWAEVHSKALYSSSTMNLQSTTTLSMKSANIDGGGGDTSTVTVRTGDKTTSGAGATGALTIQSGDHTSTSSGNTGNVTLQSGSKTSNSGNSGNLTLRTGSSSNSNSGAVSITTGNASVNSGNINLTTGTGATRGDVVVDALKLDMSSSRIVNLASPTATDDAANRDYVDRTIATVNSDTTLVRNQIHLVDTSAARSLTLPSPDADTRIWIKDATGSAEANNITINPSSTENIDGSNSAITINSAYGAIEIVSNGTDWFVL